MQDKFKKIIQFTFIILIFINIGSFNRTDAFDYKSFYLILIFFLLLLLWVIGLIKGFFSFRKSYVNGLVLAFFIFNLCSFILSPYKLASSVQFYQIFIYVGIYFIFLSSFDSLGDIKHFITLLALSIFLVSFYGWFQYLGWDFLRISHKGIVISTFVNKNFLGGFLAINLPFCFVNLLLTKKNLNKISYFLGCLVSIYALILTGSKGGFFIGFTAMFFFLFLYFIFDMRNKKLIKNIFILAIIFVVFWGMKIFFKNYGERFLMSFRERFLIWRVALNMIKDYPFRGVGIGNFVLFTSEYKKFSFYPEQFIRHACNEFLELWAELGTFGFLAFVILLSSISFLILRINLQKGIDKDSKIISLIGLASLWSGILLNLGEINLRIVYLGIYFWITIAILAKLIEIHLCKSFSSIVLSPFLRGFCFLLIIFFNFSLLNFAFSPLIMRGIHDIKSESKTVFLESVDMDNLDKAIEDLENKLSSNFSVALYNNLGNLYLLRGEMDRAKDYYRRAIGINKLSSSANYNLGYVYFLEGRIKEAYEKFYFCLKLNPKDKDPYFMLKYKILN
ncbi:MAG: O-antigen ligase family protein [Candidatus Omnitrophica bacterium]|nr:O-antigen ligase family protein [Candidatus Omnitrophota bacterium]